LIALNRMEGGLWPGYEVSN